MHPPAMGRPTKYRDELAEEILAAVASWPRSLGALCKSRDDFPSSDCIYRWLRERPDFYAKWWEAKELQANAMAEDILDACDEMNAIADETEYDLAEDESGRTITNTDVIQRSKLRVDARDKGIAHKKFILQRIGKKNWGASKEESKAEATHEDILQGLK